MTGKNEKLTGGEEKLVGNIIRRTVTIQKQIDSQIEDLLPLQRGVVDPNSDKATALRTALKQFYAAEEALGLAQTALRQTVRK